MTADEGRAEIEPYLAAMDQPTIDGFNTWCVSKLARREGMKVVLSGLGGDEVFAGYPSFTQVPRIHRLYRLLGPLRGLAARVLGRAQPGSPWRRLAAYLDGSGGWMGAYHALRGIFTELEAKMIAEALCGESVGAADWNWPNSERQPDDPRDCVSCLELACYMRNQLLRDSDIFSMTHGLELRVPFVDMTLLGTLLQIPARTRLRQGKQLLLEAVPEIPDWIRNQPKRGFAFPFQQWMEGTFGERLQEAERISPVPLNSWYRRWAVAALLHVMARSEVGKTI